MRGEEVFFIRHNGGCVWIDPPFGPLWYKHGCFDQPITATKRSSLADSYKLGKDVQASVVGVVGTTNAFGGYKKSYDEIELKTGNSETLNLKVKHNSGYLFGNAWYLSGKLCIFNETAKTIYPIDDPTNLFALYEPLEQEPSKQQENLQGLTLKQIASPLEPENVSNKPRFQLSPTKAQKRFILEQLFGEPERVIELMKKEKANPFSYYEIELFLLQHKNTLNANYDSDILEDIIHRYVKSEEIIYPFFGSCSLTKNNFFYFPKPQLNRVQPMYPDKVKRWKESLKGRKFIQAFSIIKDGTNFFVEIEFEAK